MKKKSISVIMGSLLLIIFLLAIGGAGIYYGAKRYLANNELVSNGIKTTGKITDYDISWSESKDSKKRKTKTKMYSPIITYKDSSGKSYEHNADYSSSSKSDSDDVIIYYNKNNPQQSVMGGFWHLWFIPFLILFLSMIPLGIGIFILKSFFKTNIQGNYSS